MGRLSRWVGFGSIVAGIVAVTTAVVAQPPKPVEDLPFGAMGVGYAPKDLNPIPQSIAARVKKEPPTTAAEWRARGEAMLKDSRFGEAASAFREASKLYETKGDPNAAKVLEIKAQRYETRLAVFMHRPPDDTRIARYYTGRRLEPKYGAYIGAFIDREDAVKETYTGFNGQIHRSVEEFNERIGKRHAIFLTYQKYGNPFPQEWMEHLKANGAAAQWALQPSDLSEVQDDEYLRGIARSAAEIGIPIFLRFASEMNGTWVPYHGNPALYKEKFQLVARVFHREAPNVAMVWCPNELPENLIENYYPGPEAVDWVGVNFYSVYYADNDLSRPNWWRDPSDSLDFIYKKYASRHPISIGEYAASKRSTADNQPRPAFAMDKLAQLFAALPRRYPRVKAVHWFSMNAIKWAPPSRRLNDYSLLGDAAIAAQYRKMIDSPYFLEEVKPGESASEELVPLADKAPAAEGQVTISAYVKTHVQRPVVTFTVDGRQVKQFDHPDDYRYTFEATGPIRLGIQVNDDKGKRISERIIRLGNAQ